MGGCRRKGEGGGRERWARAGCKRVLVRWYRTWRTVYWHSSSMGVKEDASAERAVGGRWVQGEKEGGAATPAA
eukprot:43723-Chlamydomonas_euryale.AAC.1